MFRAIRPSSSGAPTVFTASDLHTHEVIARRLDYGRSPQSQFPLRLDYGRSTHAYVNQRL